MICTTQALTNRSVWVTGYKLGSTKGSRASQSRMASLPAMAVGLLLFLKPVEK
jgi:hypothetical protein